ncbi:MAG TPA: NAD(P)/FAD-dependent oxidoreductase [Chloroflexi bacterium]|nr:NAD(P)/FAD-dependent oxidoreductase [Chloroflexota bacterium]
MTVTRSSFRTDVAIVGAGPAGSIAAKRLAESGVRVALLERATFPRDKVCGDGVSSRGLALLAQHGLGEWTAQFPAPEALRITSPDRQVLDVVPPADESVLYGRTIPRRLLDAQLAQAAVEAGARLIEGARVRQVEHAGDAPPTISVNGLKITAQLLILADGSHAPVTRRLGLARGAPELIALRQYRAGDAGPANRLDIHFQPTVYPGYTWLFPMEDGRVNFGTGTYAWRARQGDFTLKAYLAQLATDPTALDGRLARTEALVPIMGHPLRTRMEDTQTHAARVMVAGDAAGLVSPLTGEGIAPAMESGALAAEHALQALQVGNFSARALAGYSRALKSRYGREQRAARILRVGLATRPLFRRAMDRMQQDRDLALLIGYIIIGYKSPRLALRPGVLLRLLA